MKVVFITNVFDQTQKDFYDALFSILGDDFALVIYHAKKYKPSKTRTLYDSKYCINYLNNKKKCLEIIKKGDALLIGGVSFSKFKKFYKNKIIIKIGERFFRDQQKKSLIKRLKQSISYYLHYKRFEKYNPLFFAIGEYAKNDALKIGLFKNRIYEFAYFSQCYSNRQYVQKKPNGPISIIWVGRAIYHKHPSIMFDIFDYATSINLKIKIHFYLSEGEELSRIKKEAEKRSNPNIFIHEEILGENVYKVIKSFDFAILTSDDWEGWGLTVQDAMSQGVPVIASSQSGAGPVLIIDKQNGFLYKDKNELFQIIDNLRKLTDNEYMKMSQNAYNSIEFYLNPFLAAQRTIEIINAAKKKKYHVFESGILKNLY